MFNFLRNAKLFSTTCSILHSHAQWFHPQPHQHLLFSMFFFFNCKHPGRCEVVPHCGFLLIILMHTKVGEVYCLKRRQNFQQREIKARVKGRGSLSVFQRVSFLLCCFKQTLLPSAEFSVPSTAPHSPEAGLKSLGVGREGMRSSKKTGQIVTELGAEVQD